MPNLKTFAMPDVGEGLSEGEIVAWRVAPGDVVALNDVIVEVETAKSIVELPSPFAGVVTELLYPEGSLVPVGEAIISIAATTTDAADSPSANGDDASGAVLVGYGTSRTANSRRPRRYKRAETAVGAPAADRTYAKPPVRKLARDLGVDLATVDATGRSGQVTRDDLRRASASDRSVLNDVEVSNRPTGSADIRIPVRGIRKQTAQAMVSSAFTAPHATLWLSVDVTRTMRLLNRMRTEPEFREIRLTPMLYALRALLLTIAKYPQINSHWDDEAGEIIQYADVNLGIATSTPRGLVVPNIKRSQTLATSDLARALARLVSSAREGKTEVADMQHGTITITNIGVFGVDGGIPILNPGEAAILCVGQVQKLPWVHKNRVRPRDVMTLTLSFDHRLVDGDLGSRVLANVARLLEQPERAMAL